MNAYICPECNRTSYSAARLEHLTDQSCPYRKERPSDSLIIRMALTDAVLKARIALRAGVRVEENRQYIAQVVGILKKMEEMA